MKTFAILLLLGAFGMLLTHRAPVAKIVPPLLEPMLTDEMRKTGLIPIRGRFEDGKYTVEKSYNFDRPAGISPYYFVSKILFLFGIIGVFVLMAKGYSVGNKKSLCVIGAVLLLIGDIISYKLIASTIHMFETLSVGGTDSQRITDNVTANFWLNLGATILFVLGAGLIVYSIYKSSRVGNVRKGLKVLCIIGSVLSLIASALALFAIISGQSISLVEITGENHRELSLTISNYLLCQAGIALLLFVTFALLIGSFQLKPSGPPTQVSGLSASPS